MKTIGILYATREGQTRKIASHVSQKLQSMGYEVEIADVAHPDGVRIEHYDGAILASAVHLWRHAPEMRRFVRQHRLQLATIPTAFLSVSLCEAGAEVVEGDPKQQVQARLDAHWLMDRFFATTHWHPNLGEPVAGALQYSKYPMPLRLLMRQIVQQQGGDVDTSKDHEYTDWPKLDAFIDRFTNLLAGVPWPRPVEPKAPVPA